MIKATLKLKEVRKMAWPANSYELVFFVNAVHGELFEHERLLKQQPLNGGDHMLVVSRSEANGELLRVAKKERYGFHQYPSCAALAMKAFGLKLVDVVVIDAARKERVYSLLLTRVLKYLPAQYRVDLEESAYGEYVYRIHKRK